MIGDSLRRLAGWTLAGGRTLPRSRRRCRARRIVAPAVERLEDRTLLVAPVDLMDGLGPKFIGNGFLTITEDFTDDPDFNDPNAPEGFDDSVAQGDLLFTHQIVGISGLQPIDEADLPADQVRPLDRHIFILLGEDRIEFRGIHPDFHVAAVSVDVLQSGLPNVDAFVEFIGANGTITLAPGDVDQWEQLLATRGTPIPGTTDDLGPIEAVSLHGISGFSYFDNVRILIDSNLANRNFPPHANGDLVSVLPNYAGQPVDTHTIPVLNNDDDPELDPFSVVMLTPPQHGTAVLDQGEVRYTPDVDFHGGDSFQYTIRDDHGNEATAPVNVLVNTPPTAGILDLSVPHGTTGKFDISAATLVGIGFDGDADPLAAELIAQPQHGTVTVNADGSFTYTPTTPGGVVRSDTFAYVLFDGFERSNVATAGITVPNQPPGAAGALLEFDHGTEGPIFGVFPATDADGDPLTFEIVSPPSHARISILPEGGFTYEPAGDEYVDWSTGIFHPVDRLLRGPDSFTYRAIDPYGAVTAVSTVTINVPNHAPEANGDPVKFGFGTLLDDRFRVLWTPSGTGNEDDVFSFTNLSRPAIPATGLLQISISHGETEVTFELDLFQIANVTRIALQLDGPAGPVVAEIYSAAPGGGFVADSRFLQGVTVREADVLGPFAGNFPGFLQTLRDGRVHVNVYTDDGIPVFNDGIPVETGPGDFFLSGEIRGIIRRAGIGRHIAAPGPLLNDIDSEFDRNGQIEMLDPLQMVVVSQPSHGRLLYERDGSFTYYPDVGFEGLDGFEYQATDGHLLSSKTMVRLRVMREPPSTITLENAVRTVFDDQVFTTTAVLLQDSSRDVFVDLDDIVGNDLVPQVEFELRKLFPLTVGTRGLDTTGVEFDFDDDVAEFGKEPWIGRRFYAYGHSFIPDEITSNIALIEVFVIDADQDGDGVLDSEEGILLGGFFPSAVINPNVRGSSDVHTDVDGVNNFVEAAAPNAGDGNGDGELDLRQQHVASLPEAVSGGYVTLASPEGSVLRNVSTSNAAALAPPVNLPLGLIEFSIDEVLPGIPVTVELLLHDEPVFDTWYKFGRTPDNLTPHWYEFLYDGTTGAELVDADGDGGIEKVILHLLDGERGDGDLLFNGLIVDPGAPALVGGATPLLNADLSGAYMIDGATATIEHSGATLVFTNERGESSTGRFAGLTQVVADDWEGGLTGVVKGGRIEWANGTVWAVPQLAGDYTINGQPVTILQTGNALTFLNESGDASAGRILNGTQVVADDWEQGLIGHITGNRIEWDNGSDWSAPTFAGEYTIDGRTARIEQSGNSLTLINEHGGRSQGWIVGPNQIVAADWGEGVIGRINRGRIEWDNGSIWSVPQLSGDYAIDGERAMVVQNGRTLTFVNEHGGVSTGRFLNDTHLIADDWEGGLLGEFDGSRIVWANGTTWSAPDLLGDYTFDGQTTRIGQSGNALIFINERGNVSHGRLLSATQLVADDWGNRLIGQISATGIEWENGSTWQASDPFDDLEAWFPVL